MMKVPALIVIGLVVIQLTLAIPINENGVISAASYTFYCTGNCNRDVVTSTSGGVLLAGGGEDVDDAMKWLLLKSGGGDVLVIRSSGADGYNDYMYQLAPVNSVATILWNTRNASFDDFVLQRIANAEAIFIAGGDQWSYLQLWGDSPVQELLQKHLAKNAPIGGTSAGLAVLPEFVYTAQFGTVYSDEALSNPYNFRVTLSSTPFVKISNLASATTDTHFQERDRMGRMITFMARMMVDFNTTVSYSIGVNEGTAIALETSTGLATVYGTSNAYFVKSNRKPDVCRTAVPLTFVNLDIFKGSHRSGSVFNFNTWKGTSGTDYKIDVVNGVLQSTQSRGSIY